MPSAVWNWRRGGSAWSTETRAGVLEMTSRVTIGEPRTTLGLDLNSLYAMSRGSFGKEKGSWLFSARRGFVGLLLSLIGNDQGLNPEYYDLFGTVRYQVSPRHQLADHLLHAGDRFTLRGLLRLGGREKPVGQQLRMAQVEGAVEPPLLGHDHGVDR